ncbi:uncharacterized protein [Ptychodera flava]|uniref:uncharacterized protein n=1 Tax=Ptychodera flava TaxID=63121 RepID=UPI003969D3EC
MAELDSPREILFKIHFMYYDIPRVTPIFISESRFHSMEYCDFVKQLGNDISYIGRMSAIRLQVLDEENQRLDLPSSPSSRFRQLVIDNLRSAGGTLKVQLFVVDGNSPSILKSVATTKVLADDEAGINAKRRRLESEYPRGEEKLTSADATVLKRVSVPTSQGPTLRDREVNLEEKLDVQSQIKITLERELTDLKSPPPPLPVLPLPGQNVIEATCARCHHKGHKESGNRKKAECCYERCPGYMYCGRMDKHREHADLIREKEKAVKKVRDELKQLEAERRNLTAFIEKNSTQFTRVVKPRLEKVYQDKYKGTAGRSRLMRDVRLLKIALNGKLPPVTMEDDVEFPRLLKLGKQKTNYSEQDDESTDSDTKCVKQVAESSPVKNVSDGIDLRHATGNRSGDKIEQQNTPCFPPAFHAYDHFMRPQVSPMPWMSPYGVFPMYQPPSNFQHFPGTQSGYPTYGLQRPTAVTHTVFTPTVADVTKPIPATRTPSSSTPSAEFYVPRIPAVHPEIQPDINQNDENAGEIKFGSLSTETTAIQSGSADSHLTLLDLANIATNQN